MRKYTIFLVVLYLLFLLTSCDAHESDNIVVSTLTINKMQSTENGLEQFAGSSLNSGEEMTTNASNVFPSQAETSALPNVNFDTPVSAATVSTTGSFSVPEIEFSHQSYALYCVEDEQFIYRENSDVPVAPASLTKLLTASVALHYIKADEVFSVGSEQNLVKPESSLCLILEGHRLKLYDLISGMLMVSGNDAAYTVAVCTARMVSGDKNAIVNGLKDQADAAVASVVNNNNSNIVNNPVININSTSDPNGMKQVVIETLTNVFTKINNSVK